MNPLFLAHVIADFLLQPTWLVQWKEKHFGGVAVHASVHALMLLVLFWPKTLYTVAILLGVAIFHAFIDQTKILYQKKYATYVSSFLVDQLMHLAILFGAFLLLPAAPIFWVTVAGRGIGVLLFIYSFSIAWVNLIHNAPGDQKTARSVLTVLVFLLYITPALLLARSLYF